MKPGLAEQITNALANAPADDAQVAQLLKKLLDAHEAEQRPRNEVKHIGDLLSENLALLSSPEAASRYLKTGYKDLDQLTGGLLPGELCVLGGRPGMGVTQMLLGMALHISAQHHVLYYSLGQSGNLLAQRLMSLMSGVPIERILERKVSEDDNRLLAAVSELSNRNRFTIIDRTDLPVNRFAEMAGRSVSVSGTKLVIIDYLQLMRSGKNIVQREFEITYITRKLKRMAHNLNVAVVAAVHLGAQADRSGGRHLPRLADLRESGAIENDADKVLLLHRPEFYGIYTDSHGNNLSGVCNLVVAKNRTGPVGKIQLFQSEREVGIQDFKDYKNHFSFVPERLKELNLTQ